MKKLLVITILFFSASIVHSAIDHPIKLTSSMIKYDPKTKSIGIECKVFIDDFTTAVRTTLVSGSPSNLTKADLIKIESYFISKFKISINGKILPWKIESYDVSERENILTLVFSKNRVVLKKGDEIQIVNSLLFEIFRDTQSNWMTLRFPPFLKSDAYESKNYKQVYSCTL